MHRWLGQRIYYGWIVVGVTFLALLISAGLRSAPGVLIVPLELDLGWSRPTIGLAVAMGLLLYGLVGPYAGRLMDRIGPRMIMLLGFGLVAIATAISAIMTAEWQLHLFWGWLSGLGTGLAAAVLGAAVANRWFVARRGLVLGLFGAASSAGQTIFVPLLMALVIALGWRGTVWVMAAIALALLVPIALLMRDSPADLGLQPYGGPAPAPAAGSEIGNSMRQVIRVPEFWLLAATFFVCGATSSGLIGTHFIPHAIEHGIPETIAAGTLALMGTMNFFGTLGSGWLTDRYNPRTLLAWYYSLRGAALLLLPFVGDMAGLTVFAIVFGLDYIATVPPTIALCADRFGRRNVGMVFGWVFFAHQVGGALAAWLGAVMRTTFGDYQLAFLSAGVIAIIGGLLALNIRRVGQPVPAVAD